VLRSCLHKQLFLPQMQALAVAALKTAALAARDMR
jgi:hypothetical protein